MISKYILKKYNIIVNLEDFLYTLRKINRAVDRNIDRVYIYYNTKTHTMCVNYSDLDIDDYNFEIVEIFRYNPLTHSQIPNYCTVKEICTNLQREITLNRILEIEDICYKFGYLTRRTRDAFQKLSASIYTAAVDKQI